jgi:hypothetical protein
MRKTYYGSPTWFVATFILFSVAAFVLLILKGEFAANVINYIEVIIALGVLLLFAWASLFIIVDSKTITRRLALFFVSTHNFSDVKGFREVSDTDIYGTSKVMQIRFKNGDKWNLGMLSKKDVKEILETIKRHQ